MTNKGFYGDKLLAIALDSSCRVLHELAFGEPCVPKPCSYCELGDVDKIMAWLNAEHVAVEQEDVSLVKGLAAFSADRDR